VTKRQAEEVKRPLEDLYQALRSSLDSHSQSITQLAEEKKSLLSKLTSLQEKEIQSKKYYDENTQQLLDQQTQREVEYKKMCELCKEYKVELEEGRRQCLEMRGQLGAMGRLSERVEQLQREVCY
jgi:septation ring formation regulator EzrA